MPIVDAGITTAPFRSLTDGLTLERPTLSVAKATAGGVACVDLTYTSFKCSLASCCVDVAGATVRLNTADVPTPTNYYVYVYGTPPVVVVSTVHPDVTPGRNAFCWLALARIRSVGGTAEVFFLRRMFTPVTYLLNELGDYASDIPYTWVSGFAPTIDATSGEVDIEAGEYRRWKFASSFTARTAVPILLEDETTAVANLEQIATYADGSAITAGKYHKVLILLVCSAAADYRLVAIRQARPTVEYATREAARIDAERKAATGATAAYFAPTFPLMYVEMKNGDASDLETQDLRQTGITGSGGGGGTPIADHSLLLNLAADDHTQYSRTDGTRAFTGDIDLGGNEVTNVGDVDGVDVSAHAADVAAHHARYTDGEAVTAMGVKGDSNPLHHDRYTDAEAVTAMGVKGDSNALHHDRYTDAEAVTAMGVKGDSNALHHDRYTDAEAVAAVAAVRGYGSIYVSGGTAAQALATGVAAKLTAFTADGPAANTTPAHGADEITVTNTGVYRVTGAFTFTTSANNVDLRFFAAVGGVASVIGAQVRRSASTAFSCSCSGLLSLTAGDVVTVLVTASGNTNVTVTEAHLVVERL